MANSLQSVRALASVTSLTSNKEDFDFAKSQLKEVMTSELAACKTSSQKVHLLQSVVDGLLLEQPDRSKKEEELKIQLHQVKIAVTLGYIPLSILLALYSAYLLVQALL